MGIKHNVYQFPAWIVAELRQPMKNLRNDVEMASKTTVVEEVKNAIRDSVYENVYDAYTPSYYERRGDNHGLSDTRNYIDTVYRAGESTPVDIHIEVNVNGSEDNKHENIVPIIEDGTRASYSGGSGYTWVNSRIYKKAPYPRQFLDKAVQTVIEDGSAIGAVLQYLYESNWDIKGSPTRLHSPQKDYGDPNVLLWAMRAADLQDRQDNWV